MPASRHVYFSACIVLLTCSLARAQQAKTIFRDDFDRKNASAVGNDWSSKGTIVLNNNAALFKVNEEEFRPRMKHVFPVQREGTFTVSFLLDWERTSEGTWGVYMQLGNSSGIPRFLIREHDLAKGMSVNLLWGGGELVDAQNAGSFGYLREGKFHKLFVANDAKVANSVVAKPVVIIDVDVDSNTYHVTFNCKTYRNLPFDNEGPIDTIRFITNGCSATGFSKTSIDDIIITRKEN